jgi:hypothetical protein
VTGEEAAAATSRTGDLKGRNRGIGGELQDEGKGTTASWDATAHNAIATIGPAGLSRNEIVSEATPAILVS